MPSFSLPSLILSLSQGLITRCGTFRVMMPRRIALAAVALLLASGCLESSPSGPNPAPPNVDRGELESVWEFERSLTGQAMYEFAVDYTAPRAEFHWNASVTMDCGDGYPSALTISYQLYLELRDGELEGIGAPKILISGSGPSVYVTHQGTTAGTPPQQAPTFLSVCSTTPFPIPPSKVDDGTLHFVVAYDVPDGGTRRPSISFQVTSSVPVFGNKSESTFPGRTGLFLLTEGDFRQDAGAGARPVSQTRASIGEDLVAEFSTNISTWFFFYGMKGPPPGPPADAGDITVEISNRTESVQYAYGGLNGTTRYLTHHESGANDWEFRIRATGFSEAWLAYAEFPAVVPVAFFEG